MTGGEVLREILAGPGPAYPTAAGDNIRADLVEEKTPYPFAIFRRVSVDRDYGLDNTLLATKETFIIECWGETPAKAQALEAQVVNLLVTAGNPPSPNDPDALDPEVGVNAVTVRVDVWI